MLDFQNRTKIRQHLAFQYGIYAVKCTVYPFATPESRSDLRACAEADVTARDGSQEPACRRHFLNSGVVLITHVGRQEHEIRGAFEG